MIHTLFHLTRPLFVVDTETTGVNPQQDRVVELGFQQWSAEGLVKEWRSLINPGVSMPEGAQAVHGISDEKIRGCQSCGGVLSEGLSQCCETPKSAPAFRQIARSLAHGFSNCDFAGKNVRFDLRILRAEMDRAGVAWSYAGARIIDAERLEQLAIPRSLSHLYKKYTGEELEGAHGALTDVRASTTVIVKQLETHEMLPRDLDQLHTLQWPGWIVSDGTFRVMNGKVVCTFGKHNGKPIERVPVDYWDWLLENNFPEDVKELARKAKLGEFPQVTTEAAKAADRHVI